jgi:hypothetical protein
MGVRAVVDTDSISLQFQFSDQRGTDATHGAYLFQRWATYADLTKSGQPIITDLRAQMTESLCFADNQGGWDMDDFATFLSDAKATITTNTATLVEGSIEAKASDGTTQRLDFHAPVRPDPTESPVGQICCLDQSPTPAATAAVLPGTDAICAAEPPAPTGTFTADPFFALAGASGMNASLEQIDGAAELHLKFHHAATKETDSHGSFTRDVYTEAFAGAGTSVLPSDLSFEVQDVEDLCYVDGLKPVDVGGVPAPNPRVWNGKVTFTTQTTTRLAGFLEVTDVAGTHRLDFDAPLQTTSSDLPYYRCCPDSR